MKHIKVFKKVIMIVGIAIGLYIGTVSAELITIPSCKDVYIETASQNFKTALWLWATPFLKFDISVVPAGKQIDSVFLRVIVYEGYFTPGGWNGTVDFWNVNNQEWNESPCDYLYACDLWNSPTSNEIVQDSFGMNVGENFSVDLKPIFLRDYDSSHTYCSIKMWDPSDHGSIDVIVDSNDKLELGETWHSMFISFYPHEVSPDSAPTLFVYYSESSVEEEKFRVEPFSFGLLRNYPNPCREFTTIKYQIPSTVNSQPLTVSLKIYDITGRLVKTLVDEEKESGTYAVTWNGKNNKGKTVANGVYFYRLTAEDFTSAKKLFLMK